MTMYANSIVEYLTATLTLKQAHNLGDPSWKFPGVEAFILHYGRPFTYAPLPAYVKAGPKKMCFENAIHATCWGDNPDLLYVEGYALNYIPTLHAWLTDQECQTAYDPTWDEGHEYFGIAFNSTWAAQAMVEAGFYGIFGGENWKQIVGFMKEGIPEEALAIPR